VAKGPPKRSRKFREHVKMPAPPDVGLDSTDVTVEDSRTSLCTAGSISALILRPLTPRRFTKKHMRLCGATV